MPVKRLSRGAVTPLLLLLRPLWIGALISVIVACSSHTTPPSTFASGYLDDRGVVRLWRKDDAQYRTTTLMTLYNPLQGGDTVITRYSYQQDNIQEIQKTHQGTQKDEIRIRFAQDGTVSFMQRQLAERRELISDDDIARYQFDAKRILELSDVLRAGNVILRQGKWQDGQVSTCDGKSVRPDFDSTSRAWIAERNQRAQGPLNIAWLEGPEGVQLLLMAEESVCQWEPDEAKS
ncbi:DUF1481 domain-containing protein [Brenneria izbisi]|uniref:DUF1481 domain-containing protein n=1 Tax=Brenneria izbisi TaxID=2939450 RepID=A0AA41XWU0_9GAMM|nr:DUF1481 domain-containing protein [Brenneria izbisi]MCV9880525.1 DUF1481 domain-containing protein [Brenneria izbisi]MCV9883921.1 DUF1481 domain-containing protein [Brenneria izbisi]